MYKLLLIEVQYMYKNLPVPLTFNSFEKVSYIDTPARNEAR